MNQRQQSLIYQLIKSNSYLTTKELATCFQVSERTIHSDLNKIEDWLNAHQLPLIIERKKGTGILLVGLPHEKDQVKRLLNENDETELERSQLRQLLIFHLLVAKDGLSLEELAEKLFVGRRTIRKELTDLQSFFQQHHLSLVSKTKLGTFITGDEQEKRQLLVKNLRNMQKTDPQSPSLKEFFAKDTLKVIQHTLRDVFYENQLEEPAGLSTVEIHIYFMLERMKQLQKVKLSEDENEAVNHTQAQKISSQVLAKLANVYPIEFSPDEINYLALRIANLFSKSQSAARFQGEADELAIHLIDQVEQFLDYSLKEDQLLAQNLSSHLSSTYFRLNYGLTISNPLTKNVFSTYTQLFLVLQLILEDYFDKEPFYVPQDEIAYLTIHFQAAIERHQHQKSRRYQTILVSEYSKAMATFLEARLDRELPELTILDLIEYSPELKLEEFPPVDFILTTLPFQHESIPVIEISPMITETDLSRLAKYMLEHVPNKRTKTFDLASFTNPFLIFSHLDLTDPTEILSFMGNVLVENQYVYPEFIESVLERDRHSSTRVASLVTLPHGNPFYVKHSTISIATMKQPITWHGEQICVVLLLAVKKNDLKHPEFKKLFSVIHYLEKQPERMNQLLQTDHPLEILTLLSSYE
ncbi:BglG family transcription antiterminator [Candidatus Enterococcus courvalinii]|uniref:Transcription antiterminator n=1 Tax=Candidatus Enterococcus courvalinii TaxID=2815329 RepID=A0ABS3I1I9_9ENTE|nr:BglG family transcription antiterminator [Enterococcus sp. MSG2901]MBO0482570.1 transcription antiterminator [Enterococcus sp. MSG2901]